MPEEISEEVRQRVKEWAKYERKGAEAQELRRLQAKVHKPTPPEPMPGRKRYFTGREGVPQLTTSPRDLRDKVDPNDPATQPGPVITRKLPPSGENK